METEKKAFAGEMQSSRGSNLLNGDLSQDINLSVEGLFKVACLSLFFLFPCFQIGILKLWEDDLFVIKIIFTNNLSYCLKSQ